MESTTPNLHDACRAGEIDDVRRILDESPASLNRPQPQDGCSPLHHATFGGQVDIVDELLRRGSRVDGRDHSGNTPLHYAAFVGASDIAQRLMDAGADAKAVNDSLTTVLHMAAGGGSLDIIQALLDDGCEPDAPNLYGETPLHRAAQADRLDVVRFLAERGAVLDASDRYAMTAIQKAAVGGAVEVLEWLVDSSGALDVRDLLGDTPLHTAAGMGRTEAVRWLLEHGVEVDAINAEGATPLHAAAQQGAPEVVGLLLAGGADPSSTDAIGQSPLHAAAASGATDVLNPLMDAGTPPDTQNGEGLTPRDLAATYGRGATYRALAERGASGRIEPAAAHALVDRPTTTGELMVWYLGNSGWALRTATRLILIDYAPDGADEEGASLLNGRIVPGEFPDLPVTALVSHHHPDHFSREILDWSDGRAIQYVFGWDADVEAPGHRFPGDGDGDGSGGGGGEEVIGDVRVVATPSTDSGSAFLIEFDGFRVYHAGDHSAAEIPPEAAFADGLERLGSRFAPIDLAFLPVFGCGLPNVTSLRAGTDLTIDRLAPRVVFPMHVGWTGHFYREEKRRLASLGDGPQVIAVSQAGDRILYRNGRAGSPMRPSADD